MHQRLLYSIHPAQEKVWLSVITLVIPQSFHSRRDGFLVVRDFELLLLYPFIPVSSRSQSRRDAQLPVPFITALTTSGLRGETRFVCLVENAEMAVNTHQIRSRLRAVYRESRRLSAHSLPGLIELICACPAAHSARLKMRKDSRQRRGRTKKKKSATGRVGGGKKVETELKEKTERGRMRG